MLRCFASFGCVFDLAEPCTFFFFLQMIVLGVTVAIGVIIRYAACLPTAGGFWGQFVGQFVLSIGQVITWAGPTKLSMVWFPETERPIATSIASMSNLLGVAAAFQFCPMSVPTGEGDECEKNKQQLVSSHRYHP